MRDFGFYIYKTLYTLPEKTEDAKDKEKTDDKAEKKDEKKAEDKKDDKDRKDDKGRDSKRRERKVSLNLTFRLINNIFNINYQYLL